MNLFELSAKISADTKDYEKAVKNATKVSKSLKDIMERSATQSETNKNKIKVLAGEYSSAKAKVAVLTEAFNKAAKEEGVTAEKTQKLAKELQEAEKESSDLKGQLDELTKKSKNAGDGFSKLGSALGKGLKTAGKIGIAAVGAAAAGITALTKAAVDNYAEYEQLVGGVETLFKDSADSLMSYAKDAYKNQGVSANQYMSLATSFSASLLQSLEGDTKAAVEATNLAITDMSDNANKMGSDISSIQNAYQGFAKQNYTMLDNLKLGYGGTKEEMQRLVLDASKLNDAIKSPFEEGALDFDNIVNAIHTIQTEMGITGTTSLEAGRTISGSVGSMKAAWTNLVTGFADGNADIEGLIDNLVTTIVGDGTESNLGVIGNVLPAIETALCGIAKLIEGAAPKIIEILPGLVERVVPSIISAATGMVDAVTKVLPDLLNTVVDAIIDNAPMLLDSAFVLVGELVNGVLNQLPQIVQLGLDLIISLANGIADSLPELIPTIMDVILQIVDTLTDPKNLSNLLQAALSIITQLAWGLVDSIPALIDSVMTLIENIVTFLIDPANLAMLIQAAIELVVALGMGLIQAIPKLMLAVPKLIAGIVGYFLNYDWGSLGTNLVDGFKRGIQNAWRSLTRWFKNLFGDLIGIAKKILGIASPSKVFKKIGGFTAEGFGAGFEDEFAHVKDDMEDALNFDDASVGINASIRKVGAGAAGGAFGGTSIGNININIDGAKYSDEQSLAAAIALEIQNMTDRRAAVYA